MNAQELKDRYSGLYNEMATSGNQRNMEVFGHVMTETMDYLIQNKPDVAEEMIDKLESIRWKQYLTPKEAQKIVDAIPADVIVPAMHRMALDLLKDKDGVYDIRRYFGL